MTTSATENTTSRPESYQLGFQLNYGLKVAQEELALAQELNRALQEAINTVHQEPNHNPEKVRELIRLTYEAWRQVKTLTHSEEYADNVLYAEKIELEVATLSHQTDDPELLTKVAKSTLQAISQLFTIRGVLLAPVLAPASQTE